MPPREMEHDMEYTVELTVITENPLTEDALADVAEIGGAAGGNVGEKRLTTTLTLPAESLGAAMLAAARKITAVAPGQVVMASAAEVDEFDRQMEFINQRSELVGMSEVAELLGLSRQRVNEMVRDRNDVPMPVVRLKAGPVWRKSDWSTFQSGWQRKPGKRAKKVTVAPAAAMPVCTHPKHGDEYLCSCFARPTVTRAIAVRRRRVAVA